MKDLLAAERARLDDPPSWPHRASKRAAIGLRKAVQDPTDVPDTATLICFGRSDLVLVPAPLGIVLGLRNAKLLPREWTTVSKVLAAGWIPSRPLHG